MMIPVEEKVGKEEKLEVSVICSHLAFIGSQGRKSGGPSVSRMDPQQAGDPDSQNAEWQKMPQEGDPDLLSPTGT